MNQLLIRLLRGVFSYQIWMKVVANPTVDSLLEETMLVSNRLKQESPMDQDAPGTEPTQRL